ncbi:MAG TPA: hypothetical protein VFX25_15060 [Streptosporangiaceae bacterium]|nr:hypothetical protein [Streptosporangiaceae bacterium]
MIVPLAARYVAAVAGLLIVLTSARSIIGTVIVPRPVNSWLTRKVDQFWTAWFRLITARITDFRTRDRILASQVATVLLSQIIVWLLMFFVGYSLLLWPLTHGGITAAFTTAGPALWAIGSEDARGAPARTILDIAALCGVITVTLQISYLPTLYAAFNRRETDVALLNARAGVPSWGPELLARTHYALGSGVSSISTLPQLYYDWERWAADVTESHTTYLPLVRFRSQKPLSSWVTSLLAVLDSAALYLALSPEAAPTVPARLCLRSGFLCFNSIAQAMRFDVPEEPDPDSGISLTYAEFLDAVARMRKVDFPIEREPEEAWPHFVGWRLNYERAAYAIAEAVDAVPALWSGPRRIPDPAIPPYRPPMGRPNAGRPAAGPDDTSTSAAPSDSSASI